MSTSLVSVTRTYLELTAPTHLQPASGGDSGVQVLRVAECPPSFYRYLYAEVGRAYRWRDRLGWSDEQIRQHLADPAISLWVAYRGGGPAGYFELRRHTDGSVEIAYFGLLPDFIGKGLGKRLLAEAAERAWATDASRVWLHTCTLDNPAALPNYLARGFKPYREERYEVELRGEG
ncbi:MAG: GNAT family N-acetyltransferase [Gemmatimonadaceae bacterium]